MTKRSLFELAGMIFAGLVMLLIVTAPSLYPPDAQGAEPSVVTLDRDAYLPPPALGRGRGPVKVGLPTLARRHILVQLRPDADEKRFLQNAKRQGLRWLRRVHRTKWLAMSIPEGTMPRQAVAMAKRLPDVLRATPDFILRINDQIPPRDPMYLDDDDPSTKPCDPMEEVCDPWELVDQWGLFKVGAENGWIVERGSPDIVIAILDSGIDLDHDDLAGNIWTNPNEIPNNGIDDDGNGFVDDVHGADFCGDNVGGASDDPNSQDADPDIPTGGTWVEDWNAWPFGLRFDGDPAVGDGIDNNSDGLIDPGVFHGTFVAGIAGAMTDNINPDTQEYEGMAGASWHCSLMPVRIVNAEGWAFGSDAAAAVYYATDMGAHVINASWGIDVNSADPVTLEEIQILSEAIDYAVSQGVIVVAAAGNSGASGLNFPACMSNTIAVGSSNWLDQRSYFSTYAASGEIPDNGIDDDGNGWVDDVLDVVAPGELIWSTAVLSAYDALLYDYLGLSGWEPGDDTYGQADGTSFATPLVAGYVGLILSQNPGAGLTEVRDIIRSNALDILDPNGVGAWLEGYDRYSGYGRVRVAFAPGSDTRPVVQITAPAGGSEFLEGESIQFSGTATDEEDGDLTDSLVWRSNLDGEIGTGGAFETDSLSAGIHVISASVTDSSGLTGYDSITITVASSGTIDFGQTPTISYSEQDGDGTATVEDGGATVHLEGNAWRRTSQTYTITADTVLEFDFKSTSEGEIQGIGFDEDNDHRNAPRVFQVFGSETWAKAIQLSVPYTLSDLGSWVHFSVPVGQHYTGTNMHLVFVNDDDRPSPTGNGRFRNVRIVSGLQAPTVTIIAPADGSEFGEGENVGFTGTATDAGGGDLTGSLVWRSNLDGQIGAGGAFEITSLSVGNHTIIASATGCEGVTGSDTISIAVGISDYLDFNQTPTDSYSDQDGDGTETIEDNGATLYLAGNRWRRTLETFTITADTVLEFDFKSTSEGEIQGIGFDEDNDHRNDTRVFQIFGSDPWTKAIQVSMPYTHSDMGNWVHFSIPVGQYYTGSAMYLLLVNDDDRPSPVNDSRFRNVRLVSGLQAPVVTITAPADGALFDASDLVQFTGTATDAGGGDLTSSLVWRSNLDGQIGTGGAFETDSLSAGIHMITASATGCGGVTGSDSISITVGTPDYLDFNQTPTDSYSDQDGDGAETIEDNGATLHLEGNRWRRTLRTFTITADTVLEFDFKSTAEGEIQGIGFDEDNDHRNDIRVFQIFGNDPWTKAIQLSVPYTHSDIGNWVHFSIPVGQYYTGSDMYLVLVNDDDRPSPVSDSRFRNVRLVSGLQAPVVTITAPADGSHFGASDFVQFAGTAADAAAGDLTELLIWRSNLDGQIGTGGAFETDSLSAGTHTITASATDSAGVTGSDSISITVGAPDYLDFNQTPTDSYSDQDGDGTVTVEDNGATLHLDGNRWRRTLETFTITADTVLEFDFKSTSEGEIQGIGFDEDNDHRNGLRVFQLFGSTPWAKAIQVGNPYTPADMGIWVHFSLPVGQYYTGSDMYLVLVNDDDRPSATGNSRFRNVRLVSGLQAPVVTITAPADGGQFVEGENIQFTGVATDASAANISSSLIWRSSLDGQIGTGGAFETGLLSVGTHTITASATDGAGVTGSDSISITVGAADYLDFNQTPTDSYSDQDGDGTVTVEDNGATLHLDGNRWRRTFETFTIAADTVLEFDFKCTSEGEIQGIGLDEDNDHRNGPRVFQLFGSTPWAKAIQVGNPYTPADIGNWVHFSIPVGQHYTGSDMYLVLVNDDDRPSPTSNGRFRNVRIH